MEGTNLGRGPQVRVVGHWCMDMSNRSFEDLEAWQHARRLAGRVYQVTRSGEFARDFGLRDQVSRSVVSVMANIAEGSERKSDKDFLRFLRIASGSLAETRSHIIIAHDLGYLREEEFSSLSEELNSTGRLLKGLARYLEGACNDE